MTITIFKGDVFEGLKAMASDSVDCVVTSPPYWGLRDYGVEGQIGLEPSLAEHLQVMVRVFDEIRRVLKPTGTVWLNYGDCYATTPNGRSAADTKAAGNDDRVFRDKPFSTVGPINRDKRIDRGSGRWGGGNNPAGGILKPKDLCMIPNRLAIALQEAGWWVRSEIIWAKPNPMPDSVKDRPGVAHEKIFLLTKSGRYYYDAEAVRFDLQPKTFTTYGTTRKPVDNDAVGKVKKANMSKTMSVRKPRGAPPRHSNPDWNHKNLSDVPRGEGRGLRNYEPPPMQVWEIATRPFRDAHFATFPPELVERCLKAGCPRGGLVLDPFGGAGTTGMVADQLGMDAHLIELSSDYIKIAWARIEKDAGMMADIQAENFAFSF